MQIRDLYQIICDRRDNPTAQSYTASLFAKGEDEILKKVGEEAVEVVLAGKAQSDERLIEEVADLTYHTLVLLASRHIDPAAVAAELERRHK